MEEKKIVYVDMDGVLVDFESGKDAVGREKLAEWGGSPDNYPHIFSLMRPIEGAIEAFAALSQKYDCYILSASPWNNPTAASDKVAWAKKYLGEAVHKRLILSHHKNLNKGSYLIDDRPDKNGTDEFEGELIVFGSERFPDWKSVREYLGV